MEVETKFNQEFKLDSNCILILCQVSFYLSYHLMPNVMYFKCTTISCHLSFQFTLILCQLCLQASSCI